MVMSTSFLSRTVIAEEVSNCLQPQRNMIWSLIGKAVALYFLAKLICFTCTFLRSYVLPLLGLGIDLKSYGKWAVVTGATDGIGKSYANELARKGLNIVLISRSQEKLDAVAKEIGDAYNVETKTIAFDFSAVDGYEKIEEKLKDMNIGILVNNVGMFAGHPDYFGAHSIDEGQKLMNVNMLSAVKMTHMVLPGMLARKKGILIHVSSASGYSPVPMMAMYSSSKAFLDFFARALHIEYRDQGIISQSVLPHFVATKMSRMKPSFFTPDPDSYTRQTLQTVGVANRTSGHLVHVLQTNFFACLPAALKEHMIFSQMKMVRAHALKRKEKTN